MGKKKVISFFIFYFFMPLNSGVASNFVSLKIRPLFIICQSQSLFVQIYSQYDFTLCIIHIKN